MADNQQQSTPALHSSIRWSHYNYPPLLKLIHFSPKELPKNKKFIVLSLFIVHLVVLANTFLNFVDSCFQGGLRVLYAFLFILAINPVMLYVFQRGYTGLCKDAGSLKVYLIVQPILIVLELAISITNAFGFNGFIRVQNLFHDNMHFAGVLAIVVSLVFLLTALFSGFILVKIFREREQLVSDL